MTPGVAQGVLGVTGYEASANYVEHLKPGVYRHTLSDMWFFSGFFNPLIALLALGLCSRETLYAHPNDLLVVMGEVSAGRWLGKLVAIDATIVLAGGVLASYVGVGGLIQRLALDKCLPQFFLAKNRIRGTNHNIAIGFYIVCASLFLLLDGSLAVLSGVFALAWLAVMVRTTVPGACVRLCTCVRVCDVRGFGFLRVRDCVV